MHQGDSVVAGVDLALTEVVVKDDVARRGLVDGRGVRVVTRRLLRLGVPEFGGVVVGDQVGEIDVEPGIAAHRSVLRRQRPPEAAGLDLQHLLHRRADQRGESGVVVSSPSIV